jgi:3-hydroxyisobutyrate dehydrogenase-like beta-hydroxyacid dehydrogenase
VGGAPETAKAARAVMECYADTIVEVGVLGMGHTMKLINNFISIGNCAVIAEATATAAKVGVDIAKFCEVIQAGGANSRMFQMVMPWLLEGDDSHLKGPLRIAGKDMRFYTRLAEQAPAAAFIAQAVNQTLQLCNVRGHGDRFLPVLPGLLAELNGAKIHDL